METLDTTVYCILKINTNLKYQWSQFIKIRKVLVEKFATVSWKLNILNMNQYLFGISKIHIIIMCKNIDIKRIIVSKTVQTKCTIKCLKIISRLYKHYKSTTKRNRSLKNGQKSALIFYWSHYISNQKE